MDAQESQMIAADIAELSTEIGELKRMALEVLKSLKATSEAP
ncbi:hypothetical protein [Streptomyces triticagri]|nr:hypothetical protein [Streptomyces triticagri]